MVIPADRREALGILTSKGLSQRLACRIAGVNRHWQSNTTGKAGGLRW
jgi:hypothetical protein